MPWPNLQAARVVTKRIERLPPAQDGTKPAANLFGDIDFIETSVHDAYTGGTDYRRLTSTYSIFDADLRKKNQAPTFTLNRYNFDDAHELLIPRAVGYSAGLLNFFFRGAFSVYGTNYEAAQYVVRNDTAERMEGTFEIFFIHMGRWLSQILRRRHGAPVSAGTVGFIRRPVRRSGECAASEPSR